GFVHEIIRRTSRRGPAVGGAAPSERRRVVACRTVSGTFLDGSEPRISGQWGGFVLQRVAPGHLSVDLGPNGCKPPGLRQLHSAPVARGHVRPRLVAEDDREVVPDVLTVVAAIIDAVEITLDHVAVREVDVAINDLVAVYVDGSRQQPLIDDAGRRANDAGIDARPVFGATATAALDHEVQRSRTAAGIGNRAVGTDAPERLDPGSILRIVASVCSVDEH